MGRAEDHEGAGHAGAQHPVDEALPGGQRQARGSQGAPGVVNDLEAQAERQAHRARPRTHEERREAHEGREVDRGHGVGAAEEGYGRQHHHVEGDGGEPGRCHPSPLLQEPPGHPEGDGAGEDEAHGPAGPQVDVDPAGPQPDREHRGGDRRAHERRQDHVPRHPTAEGLGGLGQRRGRIAHASHHQPSRPGIRAHGPPAPCRRPGSSPRGRPSMRSEVVKTWRRAAREAIVVSCGR